MKRLCHTKWNRTAFSVIGNTCVYPANVAAAKKVCTIQGRCAFCHIFNRFPHFCLFLQVVLFIPRLDILQYEQMSLLERHEIVRNWQDRNVSPSLLLGSLKNQTVRLSPVKCSHTEVLYKPKHHTVMFREKSVFLSKYYCTQTTHQSEDKHKKRK